jgi:hypothetical protein
MDLSSHLRADVVSRYVDSLSLPSFRRYVTSDIRLAWEDKLFEFSVVGQNMWRNRQLEFSPIAIPRSVYGKLSIRR